MMVFQKILPQAREREQKIVDNEKRVLLTYHNPRTSGVGRFPK
jgi:hypothetical protein